MGWNAFGAAREIRPTRPDLADKVSGDYPSMGDSLLSPSRIHSFRGLRNASYSSN